MKILKFLVIPILVLANYTFADNLNNSFNSQFFTNQEPISLSPEEAFQASAVLESSTQIKLSFNIAKGFYAYKKRFKVSADKSDIFLKAVKFPKGFTKQVFDGERYVNEEVLTGKFNIDIPLKSSAKNLILTVRLQGCDDKSICYPPQVYKFNLSAIESGAVNSSIINSPKQNITTSIEHHQPLTGLKQTFSAIYYGGESSQNLLKSLHLFELILIFFIAGIVIALTPCVYPLYPIALSAIVGSGARAKNVPMLVFCYVHGIALIYVIVGIVAAFSGKLLTTVIQAPAFVIIMSIILLILGLAMFDLLEIKLPNRLHGYLHYKSTKLTGGRYITAFVMGIFSSLLLGPCITPPLIIAIGFTASSGSVLVGTLGLYAISLGMGIPIFILSLLGSRLMPKSGAWLNVIKYSLGTVIIIAAIYLAYPFINLGNKFISIGILCSIIALIFLVIKHLRLPDFELMAHKIIPILMIIFGLCFTLYGIRELQASETNSTAIINGQMIVIKDVETLKQKMSSSTKPVVLIISAKWCATCREMDAKTFTDSRVQERFAQYLVIKFDITSNQPEYYTVLKSYGLYGPPAILLFNSKHELIKTLIGFVDPERLLLSLHQ
jgi:thioredoxin:protein disulfide reductase